MNPLLDNRETSSFPLSIPSGLALETLFTPIQDSVDPERIVENLPDLSTYTLYMFNLATLMRNILNSFKFDQIASVPISKLYEILQEEIDFLEGFFQSNNVPIAFYTNNYAYFKKAYPDRMRKVSTDRQRRIEDIMSSCLKKAENDYTVSTFSKDVHFGKEHRGLIFTHIPADLLSYNRFTTLDLLESHTGKIKTRKEWNTKYYPIPNKDMSFLPFMEYLLFTFGDKTMVSPAPLKEREELHSTLLKKNVNPLTSEFSISFLKNN